MPKKTSGEKKKKKEEAKKQKKSQNKVKIDPTFGLKNKKGSRNRKFVQNARNNMNAEENRKTQERQKKKKEREQAQRLRREEEALFKTVDNDPQFKNRKKTNNVVIEEKKHVELDDETLLNNCAPDKLDSLIDKLRVKFEKQTGLTPVNEETFEIWLTKKEQQKKAEKEAKAKKKLQKKGKKGLTGKELFSVTPNIFTDDDNATETIVFEKEQQKADIGDAALFLEMDDMLEVD